jgi:drug/metabolite transporter (DMT)-like permease
MRLPEREGDWQLIIGLLVGFFGVVLILIAEVKHRQTLQMLKEVKAIEQTIKEVCR